MAVADKKHFRIGFFLALGFLGILIIMFLPLFGGTNAFHASDRLFNSIAKQSTYNIPYLLKETNKKADKFIDVNLEFEKPEHLVLVEKIASYNNKNITKIGDQLKAKINLAELTKIALKEADDMFHNKKQNIEAKYGLKPKKVMYGWWLLLSSLEKKLKFEKKFATAKYLHEVITKGIEVGYNFYKIKPTPAKARAGILSFALIFYIVYTLWWGFSIFYLFEGLGLAMTKGNKQEV
jgi:hypothetical protein